MLTGLLIVIPPFAKGLGRRLIMLYSNYINSIAMFTCNLNSTILPLLSIFRYYLGEKIMTAVVTSYFNFLHSVSVVPCTGYIAFPGMLAWLCYVPFVLSCKSFLSV